MLPSYQNSIELLTRVADAKLFKELILQLNKDVSLVGINVVFSEDYSPIQLKEDLQKLIKELIQNDFNSYANLLYRIDVSENATFLILKRVGKKVWFRNNFSS